MVLRLSQDEIEQQFSTERVECGKEQLRELNLRGRVPNFGCAKLPVECFLRDEVIENSLVFFALLRDWSILGKEEFMHADSVLSFVDTTDCPCQ